jgi:raffinose/stachyose/melibiose transport system permease protein
VTTSTKGARVAQDAAGKAVRPHPRRGLYRASINLFYLPALLLFGVFFLYPLVSGAAISFTDWDGYDVTRHWVGFANYSRLFHDATFHGVLLNTLIYGVGSTAVQQILGLALALAMDRKSRSRNVARTIIYLPVLVSPVVMGTFYYLLFQYNDGTLNDIVVFFGGHRHAWLSNSTNGVTIVVAINALQFVGVSMMIYLAGLQSIAPEYIEASRIDGAGAWQRFRHILLPLLQPSIATSTIINLIGGLKLFDVIQVMTGGGPGTATASVSTLIGKTYFATQAAGYAAAMGVGLFIVIALLTLVANTALNRRRLEQQ